MTTTIVADSLRQRALVAYEQQYVEQTRRKVALEREQRAVLAEGLVAALAAQLGYETGAEEVCFVPAGAGSDGQFEDGLRVGMPYIVTAEGLVLGRMGATLWLLRPDGDLSRDDDWGEVDTLARLGAALSQLADGLEP